jgi:hypothetical protein
MKKSQTWQFGSAKWFWPSFFPLFVEAGVDWLDSLIGPGEYLLVVSNLFAVPVLVLWGKRNN